MVEGKAGNSLVGVALSLTERRFGRWVRLIELCIWEARTKVLDRTGGCAAAVWANGCVPVQTGHGDLWKLAQISFLYNEKLTWEWPAHCSGALLDDLEEFKLDSRKPVRKEFNLLDWHSVWWQRSGKEQEYRQGFRKLKLGDRISLWFSKSK